MSKTGKHPGAMAGMMERGGKPKALQAFFASQSDDPLQHAFERKSVVHPFVNMMPVAEAQWASIWRRVSEQPRTGKSVAYIHIPFCENHCLFCGFYQNPWRAEDCTHYADVLIKEIRQGRDKPHQSQGPVHAVYFGGGTPSTLGADDMRRILRAVRECLPLAPDCEITMEGRVHNFTPDKVAVCIEGGVNRFSIGIQSFDEKLRRRQGRKAGLDETLLFLEQLVEGGEAAIIIDLIYGFPGQSLDSWENDIATAIALELDGIDQYALNLIPSSPLFTAISKGKSKPAATTGELGQFYRRGAELMDQARWDTISTTHWRRTTRERNLYNLLVKTGANCLAFGAGAGGMLGGYSFRIAGELETYQQQINRGVKPLGFLMAQPEDSFILNRIKGQMETGRLHLAWLETALSDRHNLDFGKVLRPLVGQWAEAGLLDFDGEWAELTLAGCFWQVTLTQNLLEWINQHTTRPLAA